MSTLVQNAKVVAIEARTGRVMLEKLFTFRGDTDFSQTRHLDRWDGAGVRFVFGYDARAALTRDHGDERPDGPAAEHQLAQARDTADQHADQPVQPVARAARLGGGGRPDDRAGDVPS